MATTKTYAARSEVLKYVCKGNFISHGDVPDLEDKEKLQDGVAKMIMEGETYKDVVARNLTAMMQKRKIEEFVGWARDRSLRLLSCHGFHPQSTTTLVSLASRLLCGYTTTSWCRDSHARSNSGCGVRRVLARPGSCPTCELAFVYTTCRRTKTSMTATRTDATTS